MHELGVTFHILDHVEGVAAANNVTRVSKVVLELGEVSTVIGSYLHNCWKWAASKRPLFEDCELEVEKLPAITFCENCGKIFYAINEEKARRRYCSCECYFDARYGLKGDEDSGDEDHRGVPYQ